MPVVATLTVAAGQFPLTQVLPDDSHVHVRVERIIAADGDFTPVFWITGDGRQIERAVTTIERLPKTGDVTLLDRVDDRSLYRATWRGDDGDLVTRLGTGPGTLLCARGTGDGCELVVRFPDETALTDFYRWCDAHNVPLEDVDVHHVENGSIHVDVDTEPTGSDLFIALTNGLPVRFLSSP